MTAQRLRDAARGMREKASGATPGPWSAGPVGEPADSVWVGNDPGRGVVHASWEIDGSTPTTVAYIAAMHPAVALAVADWLEREAESHVHIRGDGEPTFTYDLPGMDRSPALAVADAFLGTPRPPSSPAPR